jgi:kinesin family protein 5
MRFGMRAKAIKNKAKINAEISPAELKATAQEGAIASYDFRAIYTDLDAEVQQWRSGEAVPKDKWAPPLEDRWRKGQSHNHQDLRHLPGLMESRADTPAISERSAHTKLAFGQG